MSYTILISVFWEGLFKWIGKKELKLVIISDDSQIFSLSIPSKINSSFENLADPFLLDWP